ncbi:DUF3054 domain-containing protein [Arthrobacter sp. H14]|uniref:DUF3054 domain-containing protein n=1 Tax=Arthrobacter sp. H14 TaxID=1312959 RepID=UPI0004BC477A|nr:DUF3054 domain-containing protein [Arthrobacter sp. H14]
MPVVLAAALDAAVILLFAILGRNTHEHAVAILGVLGTAGPFLLAAAIGWSVARAWRRPFGLWPAGVAIWLVTVVGGLALRGLAGGGLAFAFQLVTLCFLGLTILGHRLVGTLALRRTARAGMNQ